MSETARVSAVLDDTPYRVMISDDLGHLWEAHEPVDLGGANTGPAPDRLLLGSLAACTVIGLLQNLYFAQRCHIVAQGIAALANGTPCCRSRTHCQHLRRTAHRSATEPFCVPAFACGNRAG